MNEIRRININDIDEVLYWSGHIKIGKLGYVEIRCSDGKDFLIDYDSTNSNILHEYIHWKVILEDGVRLSDIFDVLLHNDFLRKLYSIYYVDEMLEDMINEKVKDSNCNDKIDYLEIQKHVQIDNDSYTDHIGFSGYGSSDGEEASFGVALADIQSIKDVPIILKKAKIVTIKDKELNCEWLSLLIGKKLYKNLKRKYEAYYLLKRCSVKEFDYEYSLDEVMNAILFELSFYGNSEEKKELKQLLDSQRDDLACIGDCSI